MSPELVIIIVQFVVIIISIVIHEVSHGFVAYLLGDRTAKDSGRLTLNPIKHIDLYGSIFVPLVLYFISGGSFVFGWAKPVPFNPFNLKNPKSGSGIIALAGPLSNLILAVFGSLLLWGNSYFAIINPLFIAILIRWNIALMVFNLVPIPPLDGSKILFSLLPKSFLGFAYNLEKYGIFVFLIFLIFGVDYIIPVIDSIFKFFLGIW